MKINSVIFCWSLLFTAVVTYKVLLQHPGDNNKLTKQQYLYSANGIYRLKINGNCSLSVQQFNKQANNYQGYNQIPSQKSSGCDELSLKQNALRNNQDGEYEALQEDNELESAQFYLDDEGNPVLGGIYKNNSYVKQPLNSNLQMQALQPFDQNSKNLILPPQKQWTNSQNWKFNINHDGQTVTISKGNDQKVVDVRGISNNKQNMIVDSEDESRYGLFPGMTLHPRAGDVKQCPRNSFRNGFFQIDDHYPIIRIKDNTGYQVGEMGLHEPEFYPTRPCPPHTFQYQNQCRHNCPQLFYHDIRGKHGRCLLVCEHGSSIEIEDKICTSKNYPRQPKQSCPSGAISYELGCYCENEEQYFNFKSKNCVKKCPATYTEMKLGDGQGGICAECPSNCLSCQEDKNYKAYLECTLCQEGYKKDKGKCVKECKMNCQQCDKSVSSKCLKCSPMYILRNQKCYASCENNQMPLIDYLGNLKCPKRPNGSTNDQLIGGIYKDQPYMIKKYCQDDTKFIHKQECVNKCPQGFIERGLVCSCENADEYNFGTDTCQFVPRTPNGMYYDQKYNTYRNCLPGCLSCQASKCLKCSSDSILIVTESGDTHCQKNSPFFSCNQKYYKYDEQKRICYFKKSGQTFCDNQSNGVPHCQICAANKDQSYPYACIDCTDSAKDNTGNIDIIQQGGICRERKCSANQQEINGQCVEKIQNCQSLKENYKRHKYKFDKNFVNSDSYSLMTNNAKSISANPHMQSLDIRKSLWVDNPDQQYHGSFDSVDYQCDVCDQGYKVENGSCIFDSQSQKCKDIENRFYDKANQTCVPSCSEETIPVFNDQTKTIECLNKDQTDIPNQMKIDCSVYEAEGSKNLFYCVLDSVLDEENVTVDYYESTNNRTQVSQGLNDPIAPSKKTAQFQNRTFLAIQSSADEIALDFRPSIEKLRSMDQELLGSGIYGVKKKASHLEYQTSWLAIIAYILSILTILLHAIYIGNYLIYKVDNLLIFIQSIWYFAFIKLTVGHSLAQFYWGFSWAHWYFFPNFFRRTIPPGYFEGFSKNATNNNQYLSNSFRLSSADANFIRNAGFSLSLLFTFIVAFLVVVLMIWLLKKVCKKSEVWYYKIARDALIAAIQFVSFNIFYWAIAHMMYNHNLFSQNYENEEPAFVNFRKACSSAAIAFCAIIFIYMIVRFFFHKIGGLYMLKRIVYATILAGSVHEIIYSPLSDKKLLTSRESLVAAIVCFQLVFIVLRIILERPKQRRQYFFIIAQGALMIISFLLMYLWKDTGVISIFVSIFIFLFILVLIEDLMDVYNDARDQFYEDEPGIVKGAMQRSPESDRRMLD